MSITRLPHETDEELRIRVKNAQTTRQHQRNLKHFLWKLGIKSAKTTGISVNFNAMKIHKPGYYANVKQIG